MNRFKLSPDFLAAYVDRKPCFGWNGVGRATYLRTYSRKTETGQESWQETIQRVVEGAFNIERRHMIEVGAVHDMAEAKAAAEDMYDRMFDIKFLPPGRGLAQMGAPAVEERGLNAALYNCGFVDIAGMGKDPVKPFVFFMEALMLGVGMGVSVRDVPLVPLYEESEERIEVVIEDSRLGWVEAARKLLECRFLGQATPDFVYDKIRPAGKPLKTFGGTACGPGPLKMMLTNINEAIDRCIRERANYADSLLLLDIFNHIGVCVVSGGVRRCIAKGTLVITHRGALPIENVKKGDFVRTSLSSTESWAAVTDTIEQGEQMVMAIETEVGTLQCTAKHQCAVLIPDSGAIEWKRAGELTMEDKLAFVCPPLNVSTPKTTAFDNNAPSAFIDSPFVGGGRIYPDVAISWLLGLLCAPSTKLENYQFATETGTTHEFARFHTPLLSNQMSEAVVCSFRRIGVPVLESGYGGNHHSMFFVLTRSLRSDYKPDVSVAWKLLTDEMRAAFVCGFRDGTNCDNIKKLSYDELVEIQAIHASVGIPTYVGEKLHMCRGDAPIRYNKINRHILNIKPLNETKGQLFPIGIKNIERIGRVVETYDLTVHNAQQFMLGNGLLVHNSAEIAFGDPDDMEFIHAKNYSKPEFAHRMNYGWTSNNSLVCDVGANYCRVVDRVDGKDVTLAELVGTTGEPGFFWLENARNYSRMCDPPDYKDIRACGGNPCLEQTLESYELCCLVETFLNRIKDKEDFFKTLEAAFRYAKIVTLALPHWKETREIAARNRRIGTSLTGIVQHLVNYSMEQFKDWLNEGYAHLEWVDRRLSEMYHVPMSIKRTSVKPSGTVSLLGGATPGVHYPESRFFIRRIRFQIGNWVAEMLIDEGIHFERASEAEDPNHNTIIASFPVDGGDVRSVKHVKLEEQIQLAAFMQRWWADNQVSFTGRVGPDEVDQIAPLLSKYDTQLKGISFLPHDNTRYAQMPYEEITEERYYEELRAIEERAADRALRDSYDFMSSWRSTSDDRSDVDVTLTPDSQGILNEGCDSDACLKRASTPVVASISSSSLRTSIVQNSSQ